MKKKYSVHVVNFYARLMKDVYQKLGYVMDQQIALIALTKATVVRITNWYDVTITVNSPNTFPFSY